MTDLLYTYSLIRSFYDKGQDYIDSFWPLVLTVLPTNRSLISIQEIQDALRSRYGLDMPQHSLSVIATRAKRNWFVNQHEKKFRLTAKGASYLTTLEPQRDVERRINELIYDAQRFLSERTQRSLTRDDVHTLILEFIKEHVDLFDQFVNPDAPAERAVSGSPLLRETEALLLDYFAEVEKSKATLYPTLRDLILGSIISVITQSESPAEATKHFSSTRIYMDTNITLSILGLHHDEFNRPAQELFRMLKNRREFELRVFDFTLDELVSVLRGYPAEHHRYLPDLKVASIYSSLRVKGWTASKVREFIARIEDAVWSLAVKIDQTDLRLEKYQPDDAEQRSTLAKYKPQQGTRGQNHDLAAIQQIRKIRGGNVRRLEAARAFFLTSDLRLTRYNIEEGGHKERATIAEVIPDRVLTNILWLKDPQLLSKLSLGSIIALHSRHLFIDREVWRRFYDTLRELKEDGAIEDLDVGVLLYDQQVQEALRRYDPDKLSSITKGWMIRTLEEARARVTGETEAKLAEQKLIFEEAIENKERETTERFLQAITNLKDGLRTKATQQARRAAIAITVLLVVLVGLAVFVAIPYVARNWGAIEPITWLVGLGVMAAGWLLGVRTDKLGLKAKIEERVFKWSYNRRLRALDLERLEETVRGP